MIPMSAQPSHLNEEAQAVQAMIPLDRYRIRSLLGRGGMATVWLAEDVRNGGPVAIKTLKQEYSQDREYRQRFRNEAVAAHSVKSPNTVRLMDHRESSVGCLIIMEYIRGESVAQVLTRLGTIPEHLSIDVLEQAAHGLSAIHAAGLVHRDIKPGNILVTPEGLVKITDFGIAKAPEDTALTRTGMVVGTAQYVSPEQARGENVEPSSDVYSLGCVAYEMLAGQRPFTGDSSVAVALAHINDAPPALPPTVHPHVRELVGIMLRKDPARRYADGRELALAVREVRSGRRPPQPAGARPSVHMQSNAANPATQELGAMTRVPPRPMPATGQRPVQATGQRPVQGTGQRPVQVPPPVQQPQKAPARQKAPRRKARGGCLSTLVKTTLFLMLLFIIAFIVLVALAQNMGFFDGLQQAWNTLRWQGIQPLLQQTGNYLQQFIDTSLESVPVQLPDSVPDIAGLTEGTVP